MKIALYTLSRTNVCARRRKRSSLDAQETISRVASCVGNLSSILAHQCTPHSSRLQVGLANVGKSTLFQAITKSSLGNPANFPFATIDPEEAKVIVPDERFDWLCEQYKPKSRVPSNLTVYDIAGLTKGASTGAGLGNAFLSHIRAVDAIFQVCFGKGPLG